MTAGDLAERDEGEDRKGDAGLDQLKITQDRPHACVEQGLGEITQNRDDRRRMQKAVQRAPQHRHAEQDDQRGQNDTAEYRHETRQIVHEPLHLCSCLVELWKHWKVPRR